MKKFYLLLVLICSVSLNAQVSVARLATATARFKQVRTSSMLKEPEVRMGSFEFAAPDQIKWVYDGLENLQLPEQMLGLIRQAVSGNMDDIDNMFQTEWKDKELTMTPKKKQMKRFFASIRIKFSSDGVARQVILTEPSGDITSIEFINIRYTVKK